MIEGLRRELVESQSTAVKFEEECQRLQRQLDEQLGVEGERVNDLGAYEEIPATGIIEVEAKVSDEASTEPRPVSAAEVFESLKAGLTQAQLRKRLNINQSTLSRNKDKPTILESWTRSYDPDGIGWRYDGEQKLFYPVTPEASPPD